MTSPIKEEKFSIPRKIFHILIPAIGLLDEFYSKWVPRCANYGIPVSQQSWNSTSEIVYVHWKISKVTNCLCLCFRKGSINVIFKIIMTVNTTQDTPLIEVSSVIQAIQSEANRQLQEAVTGLLQKLISLSVGNQTIGMKKYKTSSAYQVYYVSFYHFIM